MPFVSSGEIGDAFMQPGVSLGDLVMLDTYAALSMFLTPNVTTPYAMTWINLATTGPFVVDLPAGPTAGFVNDLWQMLVTDMGLPGPDKGNGGKYLVVGPGLKAPASAEGYTVVRSSTFNNLIVLRLLSPSAGDRSRLLAAIHLYPFNQRANPPATKVLQGKGGGPMANSPRGMAYWEKLSRWINEEPVQERDRVMMAMLRPLGIVKGKPFHPDARQKTILTEATLVGEAMAKANDFDKRGMELSHYADGVQWHFALAFEPNQEAKSYTQVDERAAWFYEAACMSVGMLGRTPNIGSVYLGCYKDKDSDWLDGATNYRLHVPPNAPVKQFWSLTVYDVNTRSLIQNKEQLSDHSSREPDLVKNANGSVDLYVGPKAPAGFEKNWIPTVPGKAWFPYFRLYAPTEAHFDRTWILPDFEKVR